MLSITRKDGYKKNILLYNNCDFMDIMVRNGFAKVLGTTLESVDTPTTTFILSMDAYIIYSYKERKFIEPHQLFKEIRDTYYKKRKKNLTYQTVRYFKNKGWYCFTPPEEFEYLEGYSFYIAEFRVHEILPSEDYVYLDSEGEVIEYFTEFLK